MGGGFYVAGVKAITLTRNIVTSVNSSALSLSLSKSILCYLF